MREVVLGMLAVGLALTGCAQVSYLTKEYADQRPDGKVVTDDGEWLVYTHRARQKIAISVTPGRAGGMGFATGLTLGAVREEIPQPIYEDAARRWFTQIGRPECHTTRGYPVDRVIYEFDYTCDAVRIPTPGKRS